MRLILVNLSTISVLGKLLIRMIRFPPPIFEPIVLHEPGSYRTSGASIYLAFRRSHGLKVVSTHGMAMWGRLERKPGVRMVQNE